MDAQSAGLLCRLPLRCGLKVHDVIERFLSQRCGFEDRLGFVLQALDPVVQVLRVVGSWLDGDTQHGALVCRTQFRDQVLEGIFG